MIKAIIFDFDGTIADSSDILLETFNHLAQKYHFKKIDQKSALRLRSLHPLQIINELEISFLKIPFILREVRTILKYDLDQIKLFPGIKEVVNALNNQGFILGILTTNSKENVKNFLIKNDLSDFDFIHQVNTIFGKNKALKSLISKNHLNKNEVIYIGDEVRDIEACQSVGIKICSVSWGLNSKEILEKYHPDFLIDKPSKLLNALAFLPINKEAL